MQVDVFFHTWFIMHVLMSSLDGVLSPLSLFYKKSKTLLPTFDNILH